MPLPRSPVFTTDRQRLTHTKQSRPLVPAPASGDKRHLKKPAASAALPKPVVATQNTLLVRGANGSQWRITFGEGSNLSVVDLTHYHFFHDIGHRHVELTGVIPDGIGLDFNISGASGPLSLVGGVNVLWHMRGENHWYIPEVHLYWGGGPNIGMNSNYATIPKKLNQLKSSLSGSVSGSIFLAWATYYDLKGNSHPESSSWVANGFNWTGTFYSVGVSIPTPWGINLVGSYFSSSFSQMRHVLNKRIRPIDEHVWWGVSLGISGGLPKALPTELFSLAKLALDSTLGFARTEYSLVYGNGRDFNTTDGNVDISGWQGLHRDKSWLGWHLGINQNSY